MTTTARPQVRKALHTDCQILYRLICELEDRIIDSEAFGHVFSENIGNRRIGYFIAEMEGVAVGMISCHLQPLLHHFGMVAEIQEMVVNEPFRSKGIGEVLMESAIAFAQQLGAVQIEVSSRAYRERAHAFYQREGFEKSHVKLVRYFRR
jgi:(aminoalkyl)phosphonate N-acetyltransferase